MAVAGIAVSVMVVVGCAMEAGGGRPQANSSRGARTSIGSALLLVRKTTCQEQGCTMPGDDELRRSERCMAVESQRFLCTGTAPTVPVILNI